MPTVLERLPPGSRVAVIRLRSLGDCVLTTPAIEMLRRARSDLRIAVVVEDWFAGVFDHNPNIDIVLPPRLSALRQWRPRLCLNLHGGVTSARLTALSGARSRAGFAHFRHSWLYNIKIPRAQEILHLQRTVHTAEHLASAMVFLGLAAGEIPRSQLYLSEVPRPAPLAVIHPFASHPDKTWAANRFLELAAQLDLEPVFIGGAGDDLSGFARYRTVGGAPLAELKRLIASASMFIGNDSGPAHVAAALGVPVVALFRASDPAIWGPWRAASEILCGEIEPAQVLEAVSRLRVPA